MVADPHPVIPTDASLTGGCDRDPGLGKCLGRLRDVPHIHPPCPPLPGLARGTGLSRNLRGEAASSPHPGVGLGQSPGAEPHKLLDDGTQTRPPLTHLTFVCTCIKSALARRDKPLKSTPSKAVHFRNSPFFRVGLPGSPPFTPWFYKTSPPLNRPAPRGKPPGDKPTIIPGP